MIMKLKSLQKSTIICVLHQRHSALAALNMPAMRLVMYATILCILWFGDVSASKLGNAGGRGSPDFLRLRFAGAEFP